MLKKHKKLLIFIMLIIIAAVIIWYLISKNRHPNELELFGNIEIRQADLAFRVPGRLLILNHEEGDYVKKGDILAQLDDDTYETELASARADLAASRAAMINAESIYRRNIGLCADSTVSKQECDNIISNKDQTRSQFELLQAKLDKAIIDLNDTKLLAPNDGIILTRIQEKGTILSENTPVYSLSLHEPIWVRAYVPEADLGKIRLGQKAFVYNDSNPDKHYEAQIGFISPVAEFTPKTVETLSLRTDLVYRLRIIIEKPDPYLRQGMPVTIKIPFENDDNNDSNGKKNSKKDKKKTQSNHENNEINMCRINYYTPNDSNTAHNCEE